MAHSHIEQVLKTAGLPDDQIKALNELPEDAKDFKPEGYIAPIKTNIETQVKNDPKFYEGLNRENLPADFVTKLKGEVYGGEAGKVRHHILKGLGLSEEDFKDLGEDFKKIEVFTPALLKKLSEGKVTDKELQKKLIEANQQLEEMRAEAPKTQEKFKAEYESKITEFQVGNAVINHLATVPNLTAPPEYLSDRIISKLKGTFALAVENGLVVPMQKSNPTLRALTANNTRELPLSEAINAILETDKLIDEKKVQPPVRSVHVNAGNNELKLSKNVNDKIAKRIEEDAKAG